MPLTRQTTTTTRTARVDQQGYGGMRIAVETRAAREVARCNSGGAAVAGAARRRLPAMATPTSMAEVGFAALDGTRPSPASGTVQSGGATRVP